MHRRTIAYGGGPADWRMSIPLGIPVRKPATPSIGPVLARSVISTSSQSYEHVKWTGGRLAEAVSPCLVRQLYRGRLGRDLRQRQPTDPAPNRFAANSLLEGAGLELSVPRQKSTKGTEPGGRRKRLSCSQPATD